MQNHEAGTELLLHANRGTEINLTRDLQLSVCKCVLTT